MKLESLDPRVKLAMLASLSTASVLSSDLRLLAALLALCLCVLLLGGVSLVRALSRLRAALRLTAAVFVLQCIFNRSGEPLLSPCGVTLLTRGGIAAATAVMLRLMIILLSAVIVMTGQRRDYLLALVQLRLPYEIAFMVMAGLRFLPLLREEASDVMYAVQMRGTKIDGAPLRQRLSVYLRIAMPVVAGAIHRSEKLSAAMEARAFRAFPTRNSMRLLRMTRGDRIYLAVFLVILILIVLGVKIWIFP